MEIRSATDDDWDWIHANADAVGGPQVVSNGVLHTLADYPALIAEVDGHPSGFAVYRVDGDTCELVAIAATEQWQGVGTALLHGTEEAARNVGCTRIWLATTNDNMPAIRFYQRRGYSLSKFRSGAFSEVRALKGLDPDEEIIGIDGIPIRDELQLTKELS